MVAAFGKGEKTLQTNNRYDLPEVADCNQRANALLLLRATENTNSIKEI